MNQARSFFALLLMFVSLNVQADYSQRSDVQQFIDEMVEKHGFDRNDLELKFAMANRLDGVLEAIAKPAEKVLTWREYIGADLPIDIKTTEDKSCCRQAKFSPGE